MMFMLKKAGIWFVKSYWIKNCKKRISRSDGYKNC